MSLEKIRDLVGPKGLTTTLATIYIDHIGQGTVGETIT